MAAHKRSFDDDNDSVRKVNMETYSKVYPDSLVISSKMEEGDARAETQPGGTSQGIIDKQQEEISRLKDELKYLRQYFERQLEAKDRALKEAMYGAKPGLKELKCPESDTGNSSRVLAKRKTAPPSKSSPHPRRQLKQSK